MATAFSSEDLEHLDGLTKTFARAVYQMNAEGAHWSGQVCAIMLGTNKDGEPVVGLVGDQNPELAEASFKALQAFIETLNPPEPPPGCYL